MINIKAKKFFFGLALIFAVNNLKGMDGNLKSIMKYTGCAVVGLLGGAAAGVYTLSSEEGKKLMCGDDIEHKEKSKLAAFVAGAAALLVAGGCGVCKLLNRCD
jgi:hypothetical protein